MTDPRLFQPTSSEPPRRPRGSSVAQFGLRLLLVSMLMLFGATVVAYLVTRASLSHWSEGQVGLPTGLFASTLILVALSCALEWALWGIRRNRQVVLFRGLLLALLLGIGFVVAQVSNWQTILEINPDLKSRELSLFTFYMLTGVHALHVVGGFVPLALVLRRVVQREYSSSRFEGVRLCVQYWHFLGVVWLALLVVMAIA
jgi:cytochrome c oxidase subunit 3